MRFERAAFLQRRNELFITQAVLADKAGVSRRTVQRAETGKDISLENAAQIAAALGVPHEALVSSSTVSPPALQAVPLGAVSRTISKRDFILGGFAAVSSLFAALTFGSTWLDQRRRDSQRSTEERELAFRLLFGDSDFQYCVPSTNNPYSGVTGITLPTRDALLSIFSHFGFDGQLRVVDNPQIRALDGSLLLLGGPVANVFSRQILGIGNGSPFFSHSMGRRVVLPVTFENVLTGNTGVGKRPQYRIAVEGKSLRGLEDSNRDFLLLTSIPNVFSPNYGIFGHRILIAGGWHGAGSRAVDLLLEQTHLLQQIYDQTKAYAGWQALVTVSKLDAAKGSPIELGEWAAWEIVNVDFDQAHASTIGRPFWLDPADDLVTTGPSAPP